MCLSLDHYSHMTPPAASSDSWNSSQNRGHVLNSPAEIDAHLHNIRSGRNAHNRWFDKTYTLIVESNTSAGAMGEHSPVDALVPSIVAEYAVVQGVPEDAFESDVSSMASEYASTSMLDWVVDDKIRLECLKAEERAKTIIDNSDDSVLWFTGYGSNWIKEVGALCLQFSVTTLLTSMCAVFLCLKPNFHLTPSFKWHSSLPGTRHEANLQPHMRQPSRGCLIGAEQKRSGLSPRIARLSSSL
jgi:hypothetical protein